ncbi:hypothetical protein MEBOL_003295 [Melittangium boletus DSM 14713]|uniref:Hint domain-containing protein n=2 Tax=Melittangium boletus TaxID=83453 RepID=A0A250IF37_9BACT|nr:hypothetical protein MEBOL_003295 [Melittangium boletus DSM 14713]
MKKNPRSSWTSWVGVARWVGVLLSTAGWSGALRPPAEGLSSRVLVEDAQRMRVWYDAFPGRSSVVLNLGDDGHYAFVTHRLQAAGKTPVNSPELFRRLARSRERSRGRPFMGPLQVSEAGLWCDHAVLVRPPVTSPSGDTLTFHPYVRVSCLGGADYVYADVLVQETLRDDSRRSLVASRAGEEFGGGTDFIDVGAEARVKGAEGRLLRVESLALAVDEATGRELVSYTVARTSLALRPDGGFQLLHPRQLVPGPSEDILLCQRRGGSDCDYALAALEDGVPEPFAAVPTGLAGALPGAPGHFSPEDYWPLPRAHDARRLYVPVRALLSPGSRNHLPCTVERYVSARLKLLDSQDGVTCTQAVDPRALLPTGQSSSTFNALLDTSYLLNANRPDAPQCQAAFLLDKPASLSFTLVGEARCPNADGSSSLEPFFLSEAIDRRSPTQRRLLFREGCLAEGTPITLADGRGVPVERVQLGDRVRVDTLGAVLTVTDVARGQESAPLVLLRDSAGREVRLTGNHPVLLADGRVVAAGSLRARDEVRTDGGVTRLTSVRRVPADGQRVFNLRLGTEKELARLAPGSQTTLFAGGFLVGDLAMQRALQSAPRPAAPLARPWLRDLRHARARAH